MVRTQRMQLTMREFVRADNQVIALWFADEASRRWLESPWSDRDLDQMETETNGREYVATLGGEVVGCIGWYLPLESMQTCMLAEIHVGPSYRRHGIARAMLDWLLVEHERGRQWTALVEPENASMIALLAGGRWQPRSNTTDAQGFLTFSKPS
jgi:ribosomal protein S18 acetylase RimI-like enzyme